MTTTDGFRFIDLFCGIGGFHQAMRSLGGTCVFASDIDPDCRKTYALNYALEPAGDITKIDARDVPDHDVLCGGFPCQAFSKAGKRLGFRDPTKGTLFFDIMRIVREKHPRYILLENVRNLASHDGGNTWRVIRETLTDAGYSVSSEPVIFSPHYIGIPQHRERVFIMALRKDMGRLPEFVFNMDNAPKCDIESVLENDDEIRNLSTYRINRSLESVISHWDVLLRYLASTGERVPTFPIWTECFKKNIEDISEFRPGCPKWKADFIKDNHGFYLKHREFLDGWMKEGASVEGFSGARAKLEWQAGEGTESIWDNIFQLRPSGIRVKRLTYFPALVAMVQIPIVGPRRRRLTPRECARLQSFPESFVFDEKEHEAYKQFGNSVNVEVVRMFASFLLDKEGARERFSIKGQWPERNVLF